MMVRQPTRSQGMRTRLQFPPSISVLRIEAKGLRHRVRLDPPPAVSSPHDRRSCDDENWPDSTPRDNPEACATANDRATGIRLPKRCDLLSGRRVARRAASPQPREAAAPERQTTPWSPPQARRGV